MSSFEHELGPRQADQEDAGRGEEEEPGRGQAGQEGEEEGGGRGAGRGARGQGGWRHWRCREISTIFISLVKVPSSAFTNYQDESSPHGIFTLIQILQKLSQNFVDSSQFSVIAQVRDLAITGDVWVDRERAAVRDIQASTNTTLVIISAVSLGFYTH